MAIAISFRASATPPFARRGKPTRRDWVSFQRVVVMAVAKASAPTGTGTEEFRPPARARSLVSEYVALTKPGILTLLIATELGGMLVAKSGLPPVSLIIVALIGGLLSAGGANALNCYIDRDIDSLMTRTKKRGTVTGVISPNQALVFGL